MTTLRLPDLTLLSVYFYQVSTLCESFFNNLTIPAIENLSVALETDGEENEENVIAPICSMILRSGSCLLRVLRLYVQFVPGELSS